MSCLAVPPSAERLFGFAPPRRNRAALREIERAAAEASYEEKTSTGASSASGMMQEVDAFLRQQIDCFLSNQVQQADKHIQEVRNMSEQVRARFMELSNTAADGKQPAPSDESEDDKVGEQRQIEELTKALAQAREEAAAATSRADELYTQVEELTRENATLQGAVAQAQSECDEILKATSLKEKSLRERLENRQEKLQQLEVERLELRRSLAQRGDANTVIRQLESLQRDFDKLEAQSRMEKAKPEVFARAVSVAPLVLGIEADEDEAARGQFTEILVPDMGCRQALRLGRVRIPHDCGPVPVSTKVTLENTGNQPWPATVAAALVCGDALGCPLSTVDSAMPCKHSELEMDLTVPGDASAPGVSSSVWAIVNAATGQHLGPLLAFEVERMIP
eukprot:TRINITY_DN5946_c0_g1_i1.p1 TRINITY_DN5946_c0_g1~~TRINITY_DN5946_c0_g1_i1.p1  ORF type:complete len:410 (-),score=112.38 TRINITY_DN5946_c0_g1_i1:181-1362(-)